MKIVIDIPEELIDKINDENYQSVISWYSTTLYVAIKSGTPLSKGHGRLIDADAYRKELRIEIPNLDYDGSLEPYEEGIYSAIMSLDDTPTIIEADKAESEDKLDGDPIDIDKAVEHYEGTLEVLKGVGLEVDE